MPALAQRPAAPTAARVSRRAAAHAHHTTSAPSFFSPSSSRPLRLPAAALRASNVASGSRGPSSGPKPQPPTSPKPASSRRAQHTSFPSLPIMLAGLGSGLLMGAAALHSGGGDSAPVEHAVGLAASASAAAALYPLHEFGPAEVAQSFGPTRPLWALMLHSHAAASAAAASHTDVAAAAASTLPHLSLPHVSGAAGGVSSPSLTSPSSGAVLLGEAREAAEESAAAVRGAVGQAVDNYNTWLEESPLMCKVVTGNFFTVAGDMLAQLGTGGGGGHGGESAPAAGAAAGGRRRVDWSRTARLCIETSVFGTPLAHWWFSLLDGRIMPDDPHCPAAVVSKMLLDQVLFAPFGLLLFFAVIKCLEGRPNDIGRTLRTSYIKALIGGYLLWPVAGLLNFALLPNEYRLLFNNCVNVIWTCFLSIMSSSDNSAPASDHATASHAPVPTVAVSSAAAADSCPSGAGGVAQDLAAAAVAAAALSAAVSSGRPAFVAVAGLAVAVIEATCAAAHAAASAPLAEEVAPEPSSPTYPPFLSSPSRPFTGAGASVMVGGPCLEVCERDATR